MHEPCIQLPLSLRRSAAAGVQGSRNQEAVMFTMMFALDIVSVCRQLTVTRVNGYQGGVGECA